MEQFTFTLLLDYIYNKFALTFLITILGVVIRTLMSNVSAKQKVSIGKVLASTVFSTILMCAIRELIPFTFTVYVLVCVIVGMWSMKIVSLVMDSKFMTKFISKYLKSIAGPVAKSLSDALDDEDNNVDEEKSTTNNKYKKKEQG